MKKIIIDLEKNNLNIITYEGANIHNRIVETTAYIHKKTNIYKGIVTNIKYNIEAAFINYGPQKCGLLPSLELLQKQIVYIDINKNYTQNTLLVQLVKEEKNNKGVTLTTNINLLGYYLVLLPKNVYKIGISKKINENKRKHLRNITKNLNIPTSMGIIIRTNASTANSLDLALDLNILVEQWLQITHLFSQKKAPSILYQENNKIVQTIRDSVKENICDIIVNNKKIFKLALHYTKNLQENITKKITYLTPANLVFKKLKIIKQQSTLTTNNIIQLPSGGMLFIEKTEALVAIDINSAKILSKKNADNTALKTNLEATDEIARQIRLHNLNGLIVIDYIDMDNKKNNNLLIKRMLEATASDTSKLKIGKISDFGLLEISRQNTGYEKKKKQTKIKNFNTTSLKNLWKKTQKKAKIHYTILKYDPFETTLCFKKIRKNTKYLERIEQKQVLNLPQITVKKLENKEITKYNLFFILKLKKLKKFKNLYKKILK